ncbi:MAG TPA: CoA pyrophosphatase [Patescibacteria group bacterium]|nr:CoA pyrophosphatase [Patescibacteria group bacterium]
MKEEYWLTGLQSILSSQPAGLENQEDYLNAAVTVPLLEVDGKWSLLFEVRSRTLTWQPGEICFPGGRIENADGTPLRTAVRETMEELGLARNDIAVLGPLKHLVSPIGVSLIPFAVVLSPKAQLKPNPTEVEAVFTVPLEFLMAAQAVVGHMELATRPGADFPRDLAPASYSKEFKVRSSYPVFFYRYGEHVIWGLTARVLAGFLDYCRQLRDMYDGREAW